MTSRWITTLEEFEALAPAWDRAVADLGCDSPYLLSEFVLSWSRAFVPAGKLRILVCFQDGAVCGGLLLYLARRVPGMPVLRNVGYGHPNYAQPFWPGERAEFSRACAAALRELRGWRYLTLPQTPAPLLGPEAEMPQTVEPSTITARLCLVPGGGAEAYLATRGHKRRTNVRRSLRLAHRLGRIELRRETCAATIERMLDFQLRHNGPDRYRLASQVSSSLKVWRGYVRALVRNFARHARLDAMALRIGGELASVSFGCRFGRGYKGMLMSFDPRFRRVGPGAVLHYHLIDWCAEHGDPFIEMFAHGTDPHKRRWCNVFEPLYRVKVFPDTAAGRARRWASQWRRA